MGNMIRLALLILLITLATSGCAQRTLVVLAPDPDGKTGSISVSNEAGSVAINVPYQATTSGDARERPAAPVNFGKEALDKVFAEALSIQPKRPLHFHLYFIEGTTLTTDSVKLLPDIIAAIRERNSAYLSVIGHTDTIGTKEMNMELSDRRARAVVKLLVSHGVDSSTIWTAYHGKENPLVPTADNVREPRNRRVEIVVR